MYNLHCNVVFLNQIYGCFRCSILLAFEYNYTQKRLISDMFTHMLFMSCEIEYFTVYRLAQLTVSHCNPDFFALTEREKQKPIFLCVEAYFHLQHKISFFCFSMTDHATAE